MELIIGCSKEKPTSAALLRPKLNQGIDSIVPVICSTSATPVGAPECLRYLTNHRSKSRVVRSSTPSVSTPSIHISRTATGSRRQPRSPASVTSCRHSCTHPPRRRKISNNIAVPISATRYPTVSCSPTIDAFGGSNQVKLRRRGVTDSCQFPA